MDVRLPDGTVIRNVPDGTTKTDLVAKLKANGRSIPPEWEAPQQPQQPSVGDMWKREIYSSVPGAFARGLKDIVDTGAELASGAYDKLTGSNESQRVRAENTAGKDDFAQATQGSIVAPVSRVVGNVVGTAPAVGFMGAGATAAGLPRLGNAIASGGMSLGGQGGNFFTNLLARLAGGGISGYTTAGLVNPDDANQGALIGMAMPVGVKALGTTGKALGSVLRPDPVLKPLAQKAVNEYGIPLSASDITGNNLTKAARTVLDDAIGVGYRGGQQTAAKQSAFNRAVGKTFGADADSLTPEVLDAAKKRMGGEFDRIWNKNALQVDPQLVETLEGLRANAAKLPSGESNRLMSEIDDVFSRMKPNENGELFIPGDVANRFQSYLGRQVKSAQSFLKDDLGTLRQSIISAFNRGISADDVAALSKNRSQYKAFKTVEPLLTGAELGVAGRQTGNVPAALLPNAVRQSYTNPTGTPLADLSQIGSQFIADRVARTGGSNRAMVQNTLLGGAVGVGAFTNPASLAALPVATGLNELLSNPAVGRALLREPAAQNELMRLLSDPQTANALARFSSASTAQ